MAPNPSLHLTCVSRLRRLSPADGLKRYIVFFPKLQHRLADLLRVEPLEHTSPSHCDTAGIAVQLVGTG